MFVRVVVSVLFSLLYNIPPCGSTMIHAPSIVDGHLDGFPLDLCD